MRGGEEVLRRARCCAYDVTIVVEVMSIQDAVGNDVT